jgi:predicted esterase
MTDDTLQRAIGLIKTGKLEAARERLELILKHDRSNLPAWHWYAQTWPGAKEKARIWQACLRFNPGCEQAQQALKDLNFDPPPQIISEVKRPAAIPKKAGAGASFWLTWGMIGLLATLAVFAWMAVKANVPQDPQQYRHVQPYEYYLYVPKAYSPDKEWPLFIGIHGAGGNGLQCWQLWQRYADKEGFILLCPSIPGYPDGFYQNVGEDTVWSSVAEVQKEYRIQPRMFFSGFSAGAYFIQGFAYDYSQAVSGLSILSAGMYIDPSAFSELVPMVVVIGDQDNATSVQNSRAFVEGLQAYGFDVQYKVMPGVGHAVTKEGVDLTLQLFRKTIGK